MITLGQLKEIKDLRKVWPHEALDFTPWLAEEENIKLLGDAVGLEITVDETESSVGDFNVDIYATETGTDTKIIIEKQIKTQQYNIDSVTFKKYDKCFYWTNENINYYLNMINMLKYPYPSFFLLL